MVGQRQLINKGMMMAKIEAEFNTLLRIIVRQDTKVEELEGKLKISEKNRVDFARAYAKSIGVIVTKKQLKKLDDALCTSDAVGGKK